MDTCFDSKLVVVTGGYGFIGFHVARELQRRGHTVRIVDIASRPPLAVNFAHELIHGNVCDRLVCDRAVRGAHTVLHFAANMGGMGVIHSENDLPIYEDNHAMTINILSASVDAGVRRFFFASSACVYPEHLQQCSSDDMSLCEDDAKVWPVRPQGLYGLQKLHTEQLVQSLHAKIDIRIARFHNVYGPGGAWNNGREKAPAAFLRKALSIRLLGNFPAAFEIWGSGSQRRSFLWIGDAVEAVIRLLESSCSEPVNIGSESVVSMTKLAETALNAAGISKEDISFKYESEKPVGVSARNSNNAFARAQLSGWEPLVNLDDGMQRTGQWIADQIDRLLVERREERDIALGRMTRSQVMQLDSSVVSFAILVPITSQGLLNRQDCLHNLQQFARSLHNTTYKDTHELGGRFRFRVKLYIAIDDDDKFLWLDGGNKAETLLRECGFTDVKSSGCNSPKGHICALWRRLAKEAFIDGCDYFCLMGDDVKLVDEGWMRAAHAEFERISDDEMVPTGFGCVAFEDTTFPGMPTFPIVHRTHMQIFQGTVVPIAFTNQDGDPFLFQLYRRWGSSRMFQKRITNGVGGSDQARYTKVHAQEWTYDVLDEAVVSASQWLHSGGHSLAMKVTLDIVIPCWRVDLGVIKAILTLRASNTCSPMFIIIIDDPSSPRISELMLTYGRRPDVRIRVNEQNLGASASRNRGIKESAADWIHFLDDDIDPSVNLLLEAEQVIRGNPNAAGFVGDAVFPIAESVFTTAIHLAGVTFFWDIASKYRDGMGVRDDMPWGVTANLIARRLKGGPLYDLAFPKTGGGEDIDFCRKTRDLSKTQNGLGFVAAPSVRVTHPWWYKGRRSYRRFYMWSIGDGALIARYPEHTYQDYAPNSAEMLLFCAALAFVSVFMQKQLLLTRSCEMAASVVISNILHDCYRHFWRYADRTKDIKSNVMGFKWVVAVLESSLIRMYSEAGRVHGIIARREFLLLTRRFDWFAGTLGEGPMREERLNGLQRAVFAVIVMTLYHILFS